jgi:hypothetical protein
MPFPDANLVAAISHVQHFEPSGPTLHSPRRQERRNNGPLAFLSPFQFADTRFVSTLPPINMPPLGQNNWPARSLIEQPPTLVSTMSTLHVDATIRAV